MVAGKHTWHETLRQSHLHSAFQVAPAIQHNMCLGACIHLTCVMKYLQQTPQEILDLLPKLVWFGQLPLQLCHVLGQCWPLYATVNNN